MANSYIPDNARTSATPAVHDKYHPQQTNMTPSSLSYYHPPPLLSLPPPSITNTSASIATKMQLPLITSATTAKSVMINVPPSLSNTMPSTLSSSYSSTHSYLSASSSSPPTPSSSSSTSISSMPSSSPSSYFTWLVFLEERWTPFDMENQRKLEQTLSLGGTFVDIADTNFPHVKRVRVFPKTNYLSYLGVKYRLSRIMQPDAWLDHT